MFVCTRMQPYNFNTKLYMRAYIDCESVYSSSLAVKQSSKTLRRINSSSTFVLSWTSSRVVITVSKWAAWVWRKTVNRSGLAGNQPNHCVYCLEHELLERFSVQEWQQSLKMFSILSNILDLEWCLSNRWKIHSQLSAMFTCRDGKAGVLSTQATKMLFYSLRSAVNITS